MKTCDLYLILFVFILTACKKNDPIVSKDEAMLSLSFFDELKSKQLDSVLVTFPEIDKNQLITQKQSSISGLPKKDLKALITKPGFIDQEFVFELSKRDSIRANFLLKYDDLILTIPTDTLFASYNKKAFHFEVLRNNSFEILKPDWISVDTTALTKHKMKISIQIQKNDRPFNRAENIVLKSSNSKRVIPVYQYRQNKISSVYAQLANLTKFQVNLVDPIDKVNGIIMSSGGCLPGSMPIHHENLKIEFTSTCIGVLRGATYSILTSNRGGTDTLKFRFQGYDSLIELGEYNDFVHSFKIFSNSSSVIFTAGKKLNSIDLESFHVDEVLTFPFQLNNFTYNEFNNSYYINSGDNIIRRVNPKTNQVLEEITLLPTATDHPQRPKNIPLELAFNKNGLGTLITYGKNISGNTIFTIDAKKQHELKEITMLSNVHSYHNMNVQPNKNDFIFSAYDYIILWDPSKSIIKQESIDFRLTPFENTELRDGKLFNSITYEKYGEYISPYYATFDTKNSLIYSQTQDLQRNTWIVCYNSSGKEMNRIPFIYSDYYRWILSANGKYIIIYNSVKNSFYRFSTAYFKSQTALTNWQIND